MLQWDPKVPAPFTQRMSASDSAVRGPSWTGRTLFLAGDSLRVLRKLGLQSGPRRRFQRGRQASGPNERGGECYFPYFRFWLAYSGEATPLGSTDHLGCGRRNNVGCSRGHP